MRTALLGLVLACCAGGPAYGADEPKPVEEPRAAPKRRVYVLHSGLHTIFADAWKNVAAESLKKGLTQRGVEERDLVVLDNPFPTATWRSLVVPYESLTLFLDFADPGSRASHEAY